MIFFWLACQAPSPERVPQRESQRSASPLQHEAFVWQQQWTPRVSAAVRAHADAFERLLVLRAEVSWDVAEPTVRWVDVDRAALQSSGRPVGFALRVWPPPAERWDETEGVLAELVTRVVEQDPWIQEIHVDFDAPTAKLAAYTAWLRALPVGDRALSVTTLPTWLSADAYPALAASVDRTVLQVHWLPPGDVNTPLTLVPEQKVSGWVAAVGEVGRPFSVALPTYGYQIAFDPHSGEAIAVHAEQGRMQGGALWREVRARPDVLAPLVAGWMVDRPTPMTGVSWYRYPVPQDTLNWRWPTLEAVMQGETPIADLRVEHRANANGLVDVQLVNRGTAGAAMPAIVVSANAAVLAGDGLRDVRWSPTTQRWTPRRPVWVSPGETRKIGWVRLDRADPTLSIQAQR